ncbi:MAG TPA: DUF1320 family protein [Ignavibacteriaceae bacterium]|nr:DUF1320 family protein [Ignavibacteriaceae bacterium]
MYSTIETLKNKIDVRLLIQFVNDENRSEEEVDLASTDDLCTQRINQACSEVADEINNYLRGRYQLPVATVNSTLQTISDSRVIYNLKLRRHRDDISESEQKIFGDTTKQLQAIQRGEIILDIERLTSDVNSQGQIFTNKNSKGRFATLLDQYE